MSSPENAFEKEFAIIKKEYPYLSYKMSSPENKDILKKELAILKKKYPHFVSSYEKMERRLKYLEKEIKEINARMCYVEYTEDYYGYV